MCILFFHSGCTPKVDLDSPNQIVASLVYYMASGDFLTAEMYCTSEFNNRELKILQRSFKAMPPKMAAELASHIPHNYRDIKQYRREAELDLVTTLESDYKCKVNSQEDRSLTFGLVKESGQWKIYTLFELSKVIDELPPGTSMDFLDFSRIFR